MIYIIKQDGLFQNKVNSSLVSNCNCKMGYSYWWIFVYTFCLINIRLSLSDDANKIKTLNIERV